MTPEERALKMKSMTSAVLATIEEAGGGENMQIVIGSLGAVLGCIALASGKPDECLEAAVNVARGVIQGCFLD